MRETLEALFDLHLGIPEEVVAAAGQGLDAFLQRQAFSPILKALTTLSARLISNFLMRTGLYNVCWGCLQGIYDLVSNESLYVPEL